ncbi:hypothetical protein LUZ61_009871 [Rhynchospora tenuis]|uniref:Uncharacterized protein n=1 Tax=Rhynchospora tenuis TaxID=198213 RepID=A0AAD6EYR2_9POAL|nr:hypothetical protein LUZ61_009871 [Rhynchospora tenuis]
MANLDPKFSDDDDGAVILVPTKAVYYCLRHELFLPNKTKATSHFKKSVHRNKAKPVVQCKKCYNWFTPGDLELHHGLMRGAHKLPYPTRRVHLLPNGRVASGDDEQEEEVEEEVAEEDEDEEEELEEEEGAEGAGAGAGGGGPASASNLASDGKVKVMVVNLTNIQGRLVVEKPFAHLEVLMIDGFRIYLFMKINGNVSESFFSKERVKARCVVSANAGVNHIDLEECRRRGVLVANAGQVYSKDVADHAVGLLIDVLRKIAMSNQYIPNICDLAAELDILVVSCSLNKETHHIVNKEVLQALGKEGIIINIGRGAHIDEPELVRCLVQGEIKGAGLDVFEYEPNIPKELIELENVVLTPHQSVFTPEAMAEVIQICIANFEAFFAGKPLITPVVAH